MHSNVHLEIIFVYNSSKSVHMYHKTQSAGVKNNMELNIILNLKKLYAFVNFGIS